MLRSGAATLPFDEYEQVAFDEALRCFRWGEASTAVGDLDVITEAGSQITVSTFTNEFWTAKQRAAHSLHEISYPADNGNQNSRMRYKRVISKACDSV